MLIFTLLSRCLLIIRTLVSDIHVNSTVVSSETGKGRRSSFKEGVMADAAAVVAARESKTEAGAKASRRMSRRASLQPGGPTKPVSRIAVSSNQKSAYLLRHGLVYRRTRLFPLCHLWLRNLQVDRVSPM